MAVAVFAEAPEVRVPVAIAFVDRIAVQLQLALQLVELEARIARGAGLLRRCGIGLAERSIEDFGPGPARRDEARETEGGDGAGP